MKKLSAYRHLSLLLLLALAICALLPANARAEEDVSTLDLSGQAMDTTALAEKLAAEPMITRVDVRGTGRDARALTALMEKYPAVTFIADITLLGETYSTAETVLDLSGRRDIDPDRLYDALAYFPDMAEVNVTGCDLPETRMRMLIETYPDVLFIRELELLPGYMVSSADESFDLRGYTVEDLADFRYKLSCCKRLTYCDMCGCGLNNAQMEALTVDFPAVKFVWIVHVGTSWDMRTDTKGFSAGLVKDFEGIEFVGAAYSAYRTVTTETIETLKYCTDMEALDLGHSYGLNDVSVVRYMPKLRFLVFTDTNVADITAVGTLPAIEFLEFFVTRDKDNRRLAKIDLTPVTQLTTLKQFNCSQIPDIDISILEKMTWLERLWVVKCGFSDEQVAALRAALPNTKIASKGAHGGSNWRMENPMYIEMQGILGLQVSWQYWEDGD